MENSQKEVTKVNSEVNSLSEPQENSFVTFSETDSVYDTKQWNKLKQDIKKDLSGGRNKIQIAAGQALIMAMSNDFNRANEIYELVKEEFNARSASQLQLWFQAFGPFKMAEVDGVKRLRKSKSKDATPFNLKGASEKPWYKMEGFTSDEVKEVLMSTESFLTRINSVIKDANHALNHEKKSERTLLGLKDDKEKDTIKNLVQDLASVLNTYGFKEETKETVKIAA